MGAMPESRLIVVLGTPHRVQGSPGYPKLDDPGYAEKIKTIIFEKSADLIFEEASGRGRTTAARLGDSLKAIGYLDVDPSPSWHIKSASLRRPELLFLRKLIPRRKSRRMFRGRNFGANE
jgi:hypothetical protein